MVGRLGPVTFQRFFVKLGRCTGCFFVGNPRLLFKISDVWEHVQGDKIGFEFLWKEILTTFIVCFGSLEIFYSFIINQLLMQFIVDPVKSPLQNSPKLSILTSCRLASCHSNKAMTNTWCCLHRQSLFPTNQPINSSQTNPNQQKQPAFRVTTSLHEVDYTPEN